MYQLDTAAAKQADQTGKFIKETGKYKGKFTKAEALNASTGTHGIGFTFESESGQVANFSIYTIKKDGDKLPSYQTLMALMACMKLRNVSDPVNGKATKYDHDQKKDVEYTAPLLRDLMNKPVGVLLQSCEYEKQKDRVPTGEYGWKIELQGAFDPATEMTASEILGGATKPEMLAKMVATLADRPLRSKAAKRQGDNYEFPAPSGGAGNFDDDIPFAPFYARSASYAI